VLQAKKGEESWLTVTPVSTTTEPSIEIFMIGDIRAVSFWTSM